MATVFEGRWDDRRLKLIVLEPGFRQIFSRKISVRFQYLMVPSIWFSKTQVYLALEQRAMLWVVDRTPRRGFSQKNVLVSPWNTTDHQIGPRSVSFDFCLERFKGTYRLHKIVRSWDITKTYWLKNGAPSRKRLFAESCILEFCVPSHVKIRRCFSGTENVLLLLTLKLSLFCDCKGDLTPWWSWGTLPPQPRANGNQARNTTLRNFNHHKQWNTILHRWESRQTSKQGTECARTQRNSTA